MRLPLESRQLIGALSLLSLFLMVGQMIHRRSLADFSMFLFMALFTALFFLQVLYLDLPLADMILAVALGVTGGLQILSFFRFRK